MWLYYCQLLPRHRWPLQLCELCFTRAPCCLGHGQGRRIWTLCLPCDGHQWTFCLFSMLCLYTVMFFCSTMGIFSTICSALMVLAPLWRSSYPSAPPWWSPATSAPPWGLLLRLLHPGHCRLHLGSLNWWWSQQPWPIGSLFHHIGLALHPSPCSSSTPTPSWTFCVRFRSVWNHDSRFPSIICGLSSQASTW